MQCFTTGSQVPSDADSTACSTAPDHPRRLTTGATIAPWTLNRLFPRRAVADWLGRLALARKHSWVIGDPRIGLRVLPPLQATAPLSACTCNNLFHPTRRPLFRLGPVKTGSAKLPELAHPHQHSGTHNQKIPHSLPLPFLVAHLSLSNSRIPTTNKPFSKSEYANDDDHTETNTSLIDRVRNVCHPL